MPTSQMDQEIARPDHSAGNELLDEVSGLAAQRQPYRSVQSSDIEALRDDFYNVGRVQSYRSCRRRFSTGKVADELSARRLLALPSRQLSMKR